MSSKYQPNTILAITAIITIPIIYKSIKSSNTNNVQEDLDDSDLETCLPQKVVFLKVHKAGSKIMEKLFKNYGDRNNFLMSLDKNGPWLGGYPGVFSAEFHRNDTNGTKDEYQSTDMIYDYFRYDKKEINKVLSKPKTHKTISIIRNPLSQFLSSFEHYYNKYKIIQDNISKKVYSDRAISALKKHLTKIPESCIGEPYISVLNNAGRNLSDFVRLVSMTFEDLSSGKEQIFLDFLDHGFAMLPEMSHRNQKYVVETGNESSKPEMSHRNRK